MVVEETICWFSFRNLGRWSNLISKFSIGWQKTTNLSWEATDRPFVSERHCFIVWTWMFLAFLHQHLIAVRFATVICVQTEGFWVWVLSCFFLKLYELEVLTNYPNPIPSMHGIFTYIYHQNQPNVGRYTNTMDAMGMTTAGLLPFGQLTSDSKKVPISGKHGLLPRVLLPASVSHVFVSRENPWFSSVEPIRPDMLGESPAINFTFWWSAEAINWNLTLPRMNEWIDLRNFCLKDPPEYWISLYFLQIILTDSYSL